MKKIQSIDEYHAAQPNNAQELLQQLRECVRKAAPHATEVISYGMPAFKQNKVLVYYALYKHHIGFYPHSSPIQFFEKELRPYKTSKGAIQFPFNKPLPLTLIRKIVKFRLHEDALLTVPKKYDTTNIPEDVIHYHKLLQAEYREIADNLLALINADLKTAKCKVWHGHPVWFIDDNPIVGYNLQKRGMRLMFWSGADFKEADLNVVGAKFKDASIFYTKTVEINKTMLKRCLKKAATIQWD
jgi:uncharacterized protein YdhG (YjbR/CyaY superfamily)